LGLYRNEKIRSFNTYSIYLPTSDDRTVYDEVSVIEAAG